MSETITRLDTLEAKRKKTAGEVIFDRTVYTGIGFGVNEAASLIFTERYQHGPGKKWFNIHSQWIADTARLADKVTKAGESIPAKKRGETLLMWVALNTMGTLLVFPMKLLEDRKPQLVKKLNHAIDKMRGSKMSAEETAQRDAEVEHAIACEHKQTWPTLLIGRAAAMATAIGIGFGIMGKKGNDWAMEKADTILTSPLRIGAKSHAFEERLYNGSPRKYYRADHAPKSFRTRLYNSDTLRNYTELAGPETIGCSATSIVLEIMSKYFAKKKPIVKNPALCTADDYAPPPGNNARNWAAKTNASQTAGKTYEEKISAQQEAPPSLGM